MELVQGLGGTPFPNGKSYIGITGVKPVSRRWRGGSSYKAQPKMYNAIQKYGWETIAHEVVVENLSLEEANTLEQAFIEVYDSVRFGYNVSTGGGGTCGIPCSNETKAKISKANKGKPGGNGSYIRKYTKEHGAWNKGKKLSETHRLKIAQERKQRCNKRIGAFHPETHFLVKIFVSCTEAAIAMGVAKTTISRCARGGRKTSAGFEWRYLDESR